MVQPPFNHMMFSKNITITDFNYGTPENGFQDSDLVPFLKWYRNIPGAISPYNNGSYKPKYTYTYLVFINDITITDFNYGTLGSGFTNGDLTSVSYTHLTLPTR